MLSTETFNPPVSLLSLDANDISFLETKVTIFQIQWGTIELHISMYVSSLIIISPTSCERGLFQVCIDYLGC